MTTDWAAFSNQQLWSRAAEHHDGDAFGQLFERLADAVYTHCFRRTGLWSMAEDLTSVVFLEAWRRRRDVRICDESVLPWLLAVANNATWNAQRTLRRNRSGPYRLDSRGSEKRSAACNTSCATGLVAYSSKVQQRSLSATVRATMTSLR